MAGFVVGGLESEAGSLAVCLDPLGRGREWRVVGLVGLVGVVVESRPLPPCVKTVVDATKTIPASINNLWLVLRFMN